MRVWWCFVAVLCLTACEDRSPPAPVDQSVRPARVMTVDLRNQQDRVELVGRVQAAQSIDLAFEVSGPLKQLPVREGQEVAKGDLLAALDQADFVLAVREAEVQLRLAQQDLDRKARVYKQRGIARSAVDDATSLVELQRVRLEQARQKLNDSVLRAPFDGLVAQRFVDNFVNVNANQPILRLHAADELFVVANVPEHLSATVSPEDIEAIFCQFSFSGDRRFPLTYVENRGEADGVAQTIEVSFAMQRTLEWNVMPGMTASVTIELKPSAVRAVVVPVAAVVADAEQQFFVWLVDVETQNIQRRYVRLGDATVSGVAVMEGLADGDVIVTTGAATLQDGMKVRPMSDAERV